MPAAGVPMSWSMVSRDYRTEVDLAVSERKVSWPFAVVICTACIAGAIWAAVRLTPEPSEPDDLPPVKAPAKALAKR